MMHHVRVVSTTTLRSATHQRRAGVLSLVLCAALYTGCWDSQRRPDTYRFPTEGAAKTAGAAWFTDATPPPVGDIALKKTAPDAAKRDTAVEAAFVAAERAFWRGDMERAFTLHAALIKHHATHPLARFSASRLNDMYSDVVDFASRAKDAIQAVRFGEVHPITAAYLSMIGQRVGWRLWSHARAPEPFTSDVMGLPQRWMVSPRISPWRLTDLDQKHPIEQAPRMAAEYRSPVIAEDTPLNRKKTRPYIAGAINLSPKLGASGTYYLETFIKVTGDAKGAARSFWMYGNFAGAARVWIDGAEVMRRDEDGYRPGKLMRRMTLPPGTHRVLVKLAYQPGYRDWFDMAFLADDATPLAGSGVTFSETPDGAAGGKVKLRGPQRPLRALESVQLTDRATVKQASDMTLYLGMLASYYDREAALFQLASDELLRRRPKFAPAHGLVSLQAQTLWEVPSRQRKATSEQALRRAAKLDPESTMFMLRLAAIAGRGANSKETRALYKRAYDRAVAGAGDSARLRHIKPLLAWARYQENEGWDTEAERTLRQILTVAPKHCDTIERLQKLYHSRGFYPRPEQITKHHAQCPTLHEVWLHAQRDHHEEKLALARLRAKRAPDRLSTQLRLATALRRAGKTDEVKRLISTLHKRFPTQSGMYGVEIAQALRGGDEATALRLLESYREREGYTSWALWKTAYLKNELPLVDLVRDGKKVAAQLVKLAAEKKPVVGANDEAFYAIDFAARQYFPDRSSITLTHTMVRVMTKNAIDRHGEVQLPRNARVVMARTIKADGSVRIPRKTAGKSTLSMPGLAPGDFVELVYLQHQGSSKLARSQVRGTRFFFKMKDVSSVHSEYVIIDPPGEVRRENDAPQAQKFSYRGKPAVRFVRQQSPRPRAEPSAVSVDEHLPWVQLNHRGVTMDEFELGRRNYQELLRDHMKTSGAVDALMKQWKRELKGVRGEELVKRLYYKASMYFASPDPSAFNVELSHAVIERAGSPTLLLRHALNMYGIKNDIYLIKSQYQQPTVQPYGEFGTYRGAALYVRLGKQGWWLAPKHQDSMFNTLGGAYIGQPAVCITCAKMTRATVKAAEVRESPREVKITGALDMKGTLTGTVRHVYHGERAERARRLLRRSSEESARQKLMGALIAEHLGGAAVTKYAVKNARKPDTPLIFEIQFIRPRFAQVAQGQLLLDVPVFRLPVASAFARLRTRTTPMMVGVNLHYKDELELTLPEGKKISLRSQQGARTFNARFGAFQREVTLQDNVLRVTSTAKIDTHRVQPAEYTEFQRWAINVEQSARVTLLMQ